MSNPTPKPTFLEELARLQKEIAAKRSPTPNFNVKIASLVDLAISTLPLEIMTPNTRRSFVEKVKKSGDLTDLFLLMKAVDEDRPFSPYSPSFDSLESAIESLPRCSSMEQLAQPESSMSGHEKNSQPLSSFFSTEDEHSHIHEAENFPRSFSSQGPKDSAMTANLLLPAHIAPGSASTIKARSPSLSPEATAMTQVQHGNTKLLEKQRSIIEAKKAKVDAGNFHKSKSGSGLSNEGRESNKKAAQSNNSISPTPSGPKDSPSSNNERSVSRCEVTGQRANTHSPKSNSPLKLIVNRQKTPTTDSPLHNLDNNPPMEAEKEGMAMPEPFPAPQDQATSHRSSHTPSVSPSTPRSEVENAILAPQNESPPPSPIPTLSQLQSHFPAPEDDSIIVRSWIRTALQRRCSADDWWVENVIWVGEDLYILPQPELGNALTRFGAGYDVALGVARDMVSARKVRGRVIQDPKRNIHWVWEILGGERTANLEPKPTDFRGKARLKLSQALTRLTTVAQLFFPDLPEQRSRRILRNVLVFGALVSLIGFQAWGIYKIWGWVGK